MTHRYFFSVTCLWFLTITSLLDFMDGTVAKKEIRDLVKDFNVIV